ncbi:TIGR02452 family protein [Promicromonospora sukumoe]
MDAVQTGGYDVNGRHVTIAAQVSAAVAGTRLILPDAPLPESTTWSGPTTVEVTDESSLAAARRLGPGTACLVFASARNPGGGFLNGAQAQEEAIARSSALYAAQTTVPEFYEHHRREASLVYSDRIIVSPDVPVFRDDDGALLAEPYPVTFLTAAAPNRSAVERNQPAAVRDVVPSLFRRAARVLDVAAAHGSRRLVLGAWGCGVFGNDAADVASAFAQALAGPPRFEQVTFAILDHRPGRPVLGAFERSLEKPTARA